MSTQRDVLVTVFLRGGMDSLSAFVPHGDPDLFTARPTLALPPPGATDGVIDLDGFFGLAPAASPLLTPFGAGDLAVVVAAGSPDPTRSHFDAMHKMETATPNMPGSGVESGWLARHLQTSTPVGGGDLRAVALQTMLPQQLAQAPGSLPIEKPGEFVFPGGGLNAAARRAAVDTMYSATTGILQASGPSTLATIDLLQTIDFAGYSPSHGASYEPNDLARALRRGAAVIKADIGVEALHVDFGDWDLHKQLGAVDGDMAGLLATLSGALEAFYVDLTDEVDRYTLVVMTEFGRRVAENASDGVDHGRASCMLVMGGHANGGFHGTWPGLAPGQLAGGEDLLVTTDYRDVLAEVVQERLGNARLSQVFPGHAPGFIGVVS